MKKLYYILLIPIFIFFNGCEQTVGDEDFPYVPQIVIYGVLEDGKPIQNIYIGKTLPIGVKYQPSFANLTDADAVISVGDKYYPLTHTVDGLYSCNLIAHTGIKYGLIVNWEDKMATAETVVPIAGSVNGVKQIQRTESGKTITVLEVSITPREKESYGATWVSLTLNGSIMAEGDSFEEIVSAKGTSSSGSLQVNTIQVPTNYLSTPLGANVYVYDESFYDYYKTQNSNKVSDAIFGQSGSSVRWNVKGEGIGMFLGKTKILKKM